MRNNKLLLMGSLFDLLLLYFCVVGDAAAASGIIYAHNPITYTLGQTITSNTASCKGTLSSVSVTPALPDGLTLWPANRDLRQHGVYRQCQVLRGAGDRRSDARHRRRADCLLRR
jgi:hypothetical protein